MNIKANWTGIVDISRGPSSYSSRNGNYVWKSSDSSTSRGASVTGSINDLDLGVNSYGGMCNFKSAYMSMEK